MIRFLVPCLFLIFGSAAAQSKIGRKPSYWPRDGRAVEVEIDGYDFEFEKGRNGCGVIDGPWSHNGRYEVRKNAAGVFDLRLRFGTDAAQRSDMAVSVRIERGRAVVRGQVKGRDVGKVTIPVRKVSGYFELRIDVRGEPGKCQQHVIRWKAS